MIAKTVSAWDALLVAARAVYLQEAERLAEELKPRILKGEFSDNDEEKSPRYLNLADELKRSHPWLKTEASQQMVLACSDWPERDWRMLKRANLNGDGCDEAEDCLAHEILAVAARRGWVKPLTSLAYDAKSYPVRVPYPKAA